MITRIITVIGCMAAAAITSHAVTVSTGAALTSALDAAAEGDTIYLAPGNYGSMRFGQVFDAPVYVTAADTADRPVFNNILLRIGSRNLAFSYITFYPYLQTADGSYYDLLRLNSTLAVSFEYCTFTGKTIDDTANAAVGFGSGFGIKGTVDTLTVRYCEFTNLDKCFSLDMVTGSYIGFNYMHHYRSDGIFLGEATDLVIENNILFAPRAFLLDGGAGDHPDFIQGAGLKYVTIRNNLFNQGPGNMSQGVFTSAYLRTDAGYVTVENNILYTGHPNALTLYNLPHSTVRNNLVLMNLYYFYNNPAIYIHGSSDGTVVENNIAEKLNISPDSGTVAVRNNIDAQRDDPDADWYYGDIFTGAMDDSAAGFESFSLVPGALDTFSVTPGVDYSKFTQFDFWRPSTNVSSVMLPPDPATGALPRGNRSGGYYDMAGRYYTKTALSRLPVGVYVRMGSRGPAVFTVRK